MSDDDLAFLADLMAENGYRYARPIGSGLYACIAPYAFSHAIIVGSIGDRQGFRDRWCYHDFFAAKIGLDAWALCDYAGEPDRWFRQPGTGRRRSETGEEVDDDGNIVGAVGVIYQRS